MLRVEDIQMAVDLCPDVFLKFCFSLSCLPLCIPRCVINQRELCWNKFYRSHTERFAVADLVAHCLLQHHGQQQGAEFVFLKVGEIDAKMKLRAFRQWPNITVGRPASHILKAICRNGFSVRGMMEVEFAPGNALL